MLLIQLIGLFVYLFIGLLPRAAVAQDMSNQDYIINIQELSTPQESTTQDPISVANEGVNFKVKSGFENAPSTMPFSITLSSDFVDFGTLSPTNPIIRTVNLSVNNPPSHGYSVIASQDHPLQIDPEASGQIIPNTTCDNGSCNEKNSAEWTNALTYGFGYRCDNAEGIDCNNSFFNSNFYKHFADSSNSTMPQSVVSGLGFKNNEIMISYKVNISAAQALGIYTNTITYIAIPNF